MCIRQPGLSEATTVQPVFAIASSFHSAHLVAGHVEELPRLALQPKLPEGLAGIVVGDLQAHLVRSDQVGVFGQKLERETGRVPEAVTQPGVDPGAPVRGVDREGAEARRRRCHDQPLGISKAFREPCIQFVGTREVAGVGRDQPATPLALRKPNVVASSLGDSLQSHG